MPSDPRPGVPRLEPDEPAQPVADPGKLAADLIALIEGLGQLVEAVVGCRKKCEDAGFSPTAAEAMAVELHRHMLNQAFRQAAR